jgi:signal transduction histidine kinase
LPIALILASVFSWIVAGRLLRPVSRLSDAASALVIEPGMSLGVDAEHRELAQLESAFDALLRRTSDLLEREQRFSSQASHELRTPLTRLRLRLERIRGSTDDPSLKEQVDSALRSTRMLDRLTESLLMLARSESGELPQEPVNLCDIARRLSGDHDGLDAPVTVQPMEDEILVTGNEELLTRAVANLIENAGKYAGCHAHVALRAYRQNGEAVISVEDDGPGISPELRETALERFRRGAAHRSGIAGVWLGLSVVDAIARRHGGRVELSPGTGGGECVRIYLPAVGLDL